MEKLQVAGQKGVIKKKSKAGCVRYAECERNHAVKDGGSAVDGCKEFIASDENGGSALTCSCCGCHRNFHRTVEETDQENIGVEEQKKRKRRELKSKVWDDFTRSKDKDGNEWAICKHCKGQYGGSSSDGTSHLKKHLESMKCRAKRNGGDGHEDISTQIRDLATPTPVVMKEKSAVIDLIKQSFDEYGRRTEHWDPSLLNSRKDEILQVYQEEKEKLSEFLNKLSCRFSLDIRNVGDNLILMVQFIDESWEQQKKIISIIPRENYIQEMKKSCLDLRIDRNICFIRHHDEDDDHDSDDDEEIIESWFSQRGSLPFAGVKFEFKHASYEKLFDKFQIYLVLAIFDPRFKRDTLQYWYEEIYGSDADVVKTLKYFRDVYNEYAKESSEDYKMVDAMGRPCTSSTNSELDLYLHHLKVPAVEGFDLLAWWHGNAPFYPTLSIMARDYLAILAILSINQIHIDLYLMKEINDIRHCSEIDDGIKSALIYLSGLFQAKFEKSK